jgi:hypothetical protein
VLGGRGCLLYLGGCALLVEVALVLGGSLQMLEDGLNGGPQKDGRSLGGRCCTLQRLLSRLHSAVLYS